MVPGTKKMRFEESSRGIEIEGCRPAFEREHGFIEAIMYDDGLQYGFIEAILYDDGMQGL
jgi:hypothetical protein